MTDRGVDTPIERLVGFARRLRGAGLVVGTERVLSYSRAVAALRPHGLEELYWAGRLTLISRREDVAVYDAAFRAYFLGTAGFGRARRAEAKLHIRVEGELPGAGPVDPAGDVREQDSPARELVLTAASPAEVLRRRSFEEYTEDERALARAVIARLVRRTPQRVSRRTRAVRRRGARLDLARTFRRALRTEGELLERSWRRRRRKPRRLVVVLDVSGSMGAYARSLAQFAHAAVRAGSHVEAFAFGTRLTRITPSLHTRDPDAALDALGRAVPDWESGTRIGESLKQLIDRWGRRGLLRGAVVIILSDGLERGDPESLAQQMARIKRLARRVIWVNPLKGNPGYEPLARGMAAALPYVDDFLSGHNLASVEALAEVLARLGESRGPSR
jgi:uncharacterized protein with von Willebrand factor type A (vWA) domain